MSESEPEKPKPAYWHAVVLAILFILVVIFLATGYAWDLTVRAAMTILDWGGIKTDYVGPFYLLYVRLLDGTVVGFQVLIECSGLYTVGILAAVSIFTIAMMQGSIVTKVVWFALSILVGIGWNINRLAFVIGVAHSFGLSAFSWAHYVIGPSIDFIWIVIMWSLGVSWLKRRRVEEEGAGGIPMLDAGVQMPGEEVR